jgi:hypothetical protein
MMVRIIEPNMLPPDETSAGAYGAFHGQSIVVGASPVSTKSDQRRRRSGFTGDVQQFIHSTPIDHETSVKTALQQLYDRVSTSLSKPRSARPSIGPTAPTTETAGAAEALRHGRACRSLCACHCPTLAKICHCDLSYIQYF